MYHNLLYLFHIGKFWGSFQSLVMNNLCVFFIILLVHLRDRVLSEILLNVLVFPADLRHCFYNLLNFMCESTCGFSIIFLITHWCNLHTIQFPHSKCAIHWFDLGGEALSKMLSLLNWRPWIIWAQNGFLLPLLRWRGFLDFVFFLFYSLALNFLTCVLGLTVCFRQ